jgi:DNA-binding transcriptional ArsR family regulator
MNKEDNCSEFCINDKRVSDVKKSLKSDSVFMALAETFKTLGDPNRLKILYALHNNELCVCEITEIIGVTQSATSHQLRVLRNMRLVKYRKSGRSVFYSLDDNHIKELFSAGLEHVEEGFI